MEKKKEFLEGIKKKKVSDIVFKPEGLGVLEFEVEMLTPDFECKKVPFRVERVSTQTFSKLSQLKEELESMGEILSKFIAFPIEARTLEFYNLDMEAMGNITELIMDFQTTPILFLENFRESKKS